MVTLRNRGPLLDRFDLVLVLVLVSIVTQSLIDVRGSWLGPLVTHAVTGLSLVVATRAAGAGRRARRLMDVFVALTLLVNVILVVARVDASVSRLGEPGPDALWTVAAAITPVLIARRLVRHEHVTLETVLGAVAAYVQLAVAYALLYQSIDGLSSTHFFGQEVSTTTYTYVSLTTITTLGYGDYTPVTDLGRLAAMTEAVMGQVYLVTFVAMIVARFANKPPGSGLVELRSRRARGAASRGEGPQDPGSTEA
jgi:hypothetical protein